MPFHKKRTTTTTTTESETTVQHKIIKLTYLQSLAVNGGVSTLKDLAGETESKDGEFDSTKAGGDKDLLSILGGLGGLFSSGGSLSLGGIGGVIGGAFGKKTSTTVKGTIKSSGWRVVTSWLQPEFDKIRYAIGIRELVLSRFRYEKTSEVISAPWTSPKDISKVTLIVDEFIPPQFPPGDIYIDYYIRPELPDHEWIQINPIGHRTRFSQSGNIIPRIINFNNERPANARLEASFFETEEEVKQIRFRAVLRRPDKLASSDIEADSYSPILKSYRMLLHPRGGL